MGLFSWYSLLLYFEIVILNPTDILYRQHFNLLNANMLYSPSIHFYLMYLSIWFHLGLFCAKQLFSDVEFLCYCWLFSVLVIFIVVCLWNTLCILTYHMLLQIHTKLISGVCRNLDPIMHIFITKLTHNFIIKFYKSVKRMKEKIHIYIYIYAINFLGGHYLFIWCLSCQS